MIKRKYVKPQIAFEDFSLNAGFASVTTDCEGIVDNPSKGSCAVISTGDIAVFDGNVKGNACVFTPQEMGGAEPDKWDGFCYHVPTEYNNLFNS